jgi:SAM-dependent methyltransferase
MSWDYLPSTYDAVAAKYEARFSDELRDKPRDRELLEAFAATVGDPVADVGCGPGQIGAFVRERGRRVFGVDLSTEMARLANARLDAALVADMRSLPFPSGCLGGLLAFYSVIHVRRSELQSVVREFHRVLRPGGRLMVSSQEGHDEVTRDEFLGEAVRVTGTFFELDELVRTSQAAGLEVTVAQRRAPYPSEGEIVRLYVEAKKADSVS